MKTQIHNIIDHFYCSDSDKVVKASVLLSDLSDHFPLLVTIQHAQVKVKQEDVEMIVRDYSQINEELLLLDAEEKLLHLHSLILSNSELDIHEKFDRLEQVLTLIMDKHIPKMITNKNKRTVKTLPWSNQYMRRSINIKNKMFKKLCKCKFKNKALLKKYKEHRNETTHIKSKSKRSYYHKLFQNSHGDIRKTWSVINNVMKRKQKTSNVPAEIKYAGNMLTEPLHVLNGLNKHFSSVGKSLFSQPVKFTEISKTLKKHLLIPLCGMISQNKKLLT